MSFIVRNHSDLSHNISFHRLTFDFIQLGAAWCTRSTFSLLLLKEKCYERIGMRITIFKIFIWRDILWDIRLETTFNGSAL